MFTELAEPKARRPEEAPLRMEIVVTPELASKLIRPFKETVPSDCPAAGKVAVPADPTTSADPAASDPETRSVPPLTVVPPL